MSNGDTVTGWINHARLLIQAIRDGRIEAKTIIDMDDSQLEEYVTRLKSEAHAEVDRGRELENNP